DLAQRLKDISQERHETLYNEKTIKLLSLIIEKLSELMTPDDWEIEIGDPNDYEIYDVTDNDEVVNAIYISNHDSGNPMLILDLGNMHDVEAFIRDQDSWGALLLILLNKLEFNNEYAKILLGKSGIDRSELRSRVEFIRLNYVMQGKKLFEPQAYQYNPVNISVRYDSNIDYAQFADIVSVMNEYNIHRSILDKYLRIYQVIENYMYKYQICSLYADYGYSRLSVRDFKCLSERLSRKEQESLDKLFDAVGNVSIDGIKLVDRVADSWANVIDIDQNLRAHMRRLCIQLGIRIDNGIPTVNATNHERILAFFGKLIYKMRCSIVHNKVNEYHISYDNLDTMTKQLLEDFLMPNMELVTYGLMLTNNAYVMYQHKELNLY
ncbi:MAG: hypothetical protein IIY49_07575, partial [Eubacterium sp.]|nr:hypothetical protein [Eubacterium sp.]